MEKLRDVAFDPGEGVGPPVLLLVGPRLFHADHGDEVGHLSAHHARTQLAHVAAEDALHGDGAGIHKRVHGLELGLLHRPTTRRLAP